MRVPLLKTLSLAATVLAACRIVPAPPDPFLVPRQAFFDSVRTVVVTPATVVGEIAVPDSALEQIETLIEDRLQQIGVSVVPASEYAAIWSTIAEAAGGFFDPYTGARDDEKFGRAAERLQSELTERYGIDGLLYPEIWEVEAAFSGGVATWGGVTQAVTGSAGYSGDVRAATLFVAVQDTAGNELYVHEAGMQVLEYMVRGRLTPLSDDRLFNDSALIAAAVSRALDPLTQGRTALPPGS